MGLLPSSSILVLILIDYNLGNLPFLNDLILVISFFTLLEEGYWALYLQGAENLDWQCNLLIGFYYMLLLDKDYRGITISYV